MGNLTSSEEFEEYGRVAASFPYFLSHYVYTDDKGGMKLDPWPWQIGLAKELQKRPLLNILKARQIGMTWIGGSYVLWTAITERGARNLVLSQTESDAYKVLERIKFIFEQLPEWMKPEVGRNNKSTLEFPKLHSWIEALPSTEKAGRGVTARVVLADEWAFHMWAEKNFAALHPTIEAGGQFIGLSTANGIGNLFADVWGKSGHPDSEWFRIFLAYNRRPGRDEAWYERQVKTYPQPWMIHQEFPRDPDESFVQTGRPVFDKTYLDKHRELCSEPLPVHRWPRPLQPIHPDILKVWSHPIDEHLYIGGVDVAEGLEHGDYSDLVVFDMECNPPREILNLHGHFDPDTLATHLKTISTLYPGLYGIERNNHGHSVILQARKLGVEWLYRERPILTPQGVEIGPGKLGWLTTASSKPMAVDEWAMALRDFDVQLSDADSIPEHVFYQTLKDGKTSAPEGQWDDRVMSRVICWQMRKYLSDNIKPDGRRIDTRTLIGRNMEV